MRREDSGFAGPPGAVTFAARVSWGRPALSHVARDRSPAGLRDAPGYTRGIPQHLQIDPAASSVLPVDRPGLWRGVLRHAPFRRLWFGAMISSIGTWMEGLGVQWLMAEQTGSTVMLGWLAVAQLGPMLVLGILGGLATDRLDRRALLLATQAAMMAIAAGLTIASATDHATPAVLLALGLLNGVAMAFNAPAWQVQTPRLVPREELHRAIALQGLQFNLARVVGPALAGALLAWTSATVLFALNTVSFVAVLWAVRSTAPAPPPTGARASAPAQVLEALRFVFGGAGPRALFLMLVILSALAAPLQRMLPLFVSEVFHAGETAYGLLLGLFGAGAVLGGLTLGRWPSWYPRHHLIPLSLMLTGVCMTGFCATRSLAIAGAWIFAAGLAWIWAFSSTMTAVQLLVGDAMRGRVLSVINMAMFGAMPLGSMLAALIGGPAATWFAAPDHASAAIQLGVGLSTALLAISGAVLVIWRTPEIDDPQPGPASPPRARNLWRGVTARAHRPDRPGPVG